MKYLKKFEGFVSEGAAEPAPAPGRSDPGRSPGESPTIAPAKPKTDPGTKPGRPSPIRRDKPAVEPAPKAEGEDLPTASIEDVINKYAELTNQK
jgi:hypothetical protein